MKIIDCHVHQSKQIDPATASAWLEQSGLDAAHIFSIRPWASDDGGKRDIENLAELARALPGRIIPLAWIDPTDGRAAKIAEWAVKDCGFVGFKMICTSWYPDDPRAREIYSLAEQLGVPIQFHCGILWIDGDNSRFNRPAGFEALWHFPRLRFSLAHIGWPWVDECVAVIQKLRVMNSRDPSRDPFQASVDLTPGTPLIYRKDAFYKTLTCCRAEYMMFGSDNILPDVPLPKAKLQRDIDLLTELGCTQQDLDAIFAGNARRFLEKRK